MTQSKKNFIYQNEEFTCSNCKKLNDLPLRKIRNHCNNCLCSMHLDEEVPGDRASACKGLMLPIRTFQTGSKGWMVEHECIKCHKKIPNIILDDDNWDKVIELAKPI